jgi:hypothetical protein
MDKFDIVMGLMKDGLAVALDSRVETLKRVWVLSEIGKSLETGKQIRWQMPNDIDDRFCGASDVQITSVRDCSASLKADKDRILQQIEHGVEGGISGFDANVARDVSPLLRNYAILKMVRNNEPERQSYSCN